MTDDPDALGPAGTGSSIPTEPTPPTRPHEPGSAPADDTGTVAPSDPSDAVRTVPAEQVGGTSGSGDHGSELPPVSSLEDHSSIDHGAVDPEAGDGDALDDGTVGDGDGDGTVGDGDVGDGDLGDGDLEDGDLEDEDLESEDEASGRRRGGLLTKQVQVDARLILAIVAVLALFGGAYVLGQRQGKSRGEGTTKPTTASTSAAAVPKDFAKFEDKDTGVSLSYPRDWTQFSTKDLDASYRLLIGVPNAKDNLRVRVNAYSKDVTKENVGDQKAVIDAIFTDEKVNIISANAVELNGLPALFYVYKFTDSTGAPGYHAHFFVFQGRKMVSLVFEAVPEARYAQLAEVFDKIAGSVQITPGPPPAFLEPITGTTVPGATTTPPASGPATTATP